MNLQEQIRKVLKEETNLSRIEEKTKLEKEVKRVIDKLTKDYEFPNNFYGFTVTTFIDNTFLTKREVDAGYSGDRVISITGLFKKPFLEKESDELLSIMRKIAPKIKAMFSPYYDKINLHSNATIDSYISHLDFYENEPMYSPYKF